MWESQTVSNPDSAPKWLLVQIISKIFDGVTYQPDWYSCFPVASIFSYPFLSICWFPTHATSPCSVFAFDMLLFFIIFTGILCLWCRFVISWWNFWVVQFNWSEFSEDFDCYSSKTWWLWQQLLFLFVYYMYTSVCWYKGGSGDSIEWFKVFFNSWYGSQEICKLVLITAFVSWLGLRQCNLR